MVSPGLIRRIAIFKEALRKLRKLAKYEKYEFMRDFRNIDSAERNLEIAIHSLIDVGNYIIAYLKLGTPLRYRDIPQILYTNRLLEEEEFKLFRDIISFRHILVHLYADVDKDKIYELITTRLNDLERIMTGLIEILKRREIDP